MPIPKDYLVFGNAYTDGATTRGGWFVARFIHAEFGVRCRSGKQVPDALGDFELKLRRHHSGESESRLFPFNRTATTFSMLIGDGHCVYYFCYGGNWERVVLQHDGDYVIWGPNVGHKWFIAKASSVFTVRSPAVDLDDQDDTTIDSIPSELKRLFKEFDPPNPT